MRKKKVLGDDAGPDAVTEGRGAVEKMKDREKEGDREPGLAGAELGRGEPEMTETEKGAVRAKRASEQLEDEGGKDVEGDRGPSENSGRMGQPVPLPLIQGPKAIEVASGPASGSVPR